MYSVVACQVICILSEDRTVLNIFLRDKYGKMITFNIKGCEENRIH